MSSADSLKAFRQNIQDAIDSALSILGGEPINRAFYDQLEKRWSVSHDQIPCKLEVFHEALVEMFGEGSQILERRICRMLYENLGLEYLVSEGKTLKNYVDEALVNLQESRVN